MNIRKTSYSLKNRCWYFMKVDMFNYALSNKMSELFPPGRNVPSDRSEFTIRHVGMYRLQCRYVPISPSIT